MAERNVAERTKACEEEREFCKNRYQKQLERDEMEFQQQKRKLIAEYDEQKHFVNESIKQERTQVESAHRRQIENLRGEIEQERGSKEIAQEDLRKKHSIELVKLRERLSIEKEEWQANYMKKLEVQVKQREKDLKEKLVKERDDEIEMVIQRLESETNSSQSDVSRSYRMEIQRLKTESCQQMKQLKEQHSLALDKILSVQNFANQLETEKHSLQKQVLGIEHQLTTRETLIKQQKHDLERLSVNEQQLSVMIRQEFQEALDAKESTILQFQELVATYQNQNETLKQRHEKAIETIESEKDQQVLQLEEKVTQTLAHKDHIIDALKEKHAEQQAKNKMLEDFIEKQRLVIHF